MIKKFWEQMMIKKFWNDISLFETCERKNESQNSLLSEARAGARMEAYVNLFNPIIFGSVF